MGCGASQPYWVLHPLMVAQNMLLGVWNEQYFGSGNSLNKISGERSKVGPGYEPTL
jgi:hypothetical protein